MHVRPVEWLLVDQISFLGWMGKDGDVLNREWSQWWEDAAPVQCIAENVGGGDDDDDE